jgi:hypothetical protein
MQFVSPFTLDPKEKTMKMYINENIVNTFLFTEGVCKTKDAISKQSEQLYLS